MCILIFLLLITMVSLAYIDFKLYFKLPKLYKCSFYYMLPGGGIIGYILWKRKEKKKN